MNVTGTAIVASSTDWQDADAISAVAYAYHLSVLRIAGPDASGTSADIAMLEAKVLGWHQTTLYVAQGTMQGSGWGDSLASAPLTGGSMQGLLLTAGPTAALPADLTSALTAAGPPPSGLGSGVTTGLQQLGGPLAVTAAQYTEMRSALAAG